MLYLFCKNLRICKNFLGKKETLNRQGFKPRKKKRKKWPKLRAQSSFLKLASRAQHVHFSFPHPFSSGMFFLYIAVGVGPVPFVFFPNPWHLQVRFFPHPFICLTCAFVLLLYLVGPAPGHTLLNAISFPSRPLIA